MATDSQGVYLSGIEWPERHTRTQRVAGTSKTASVLLTAFVKVSANKKEEKRERANEICLIAGYRRVMLVLP